MANGGIIGPVNTTQKKKKPKVSIFTSTGTLTTDSDTTTVKVYGIAGGGGGSGGSCDGGGGGAGGLRNGVAATVSGSSPYTVTIGAGGSANTNISANAPDGNDTIFAPCTSSEVKSNGGGGGGGYNTSGADGGSGGGSGGNAPACSKGCGNEGCFSPPEGFPGTPRTPNHRGGGGGGSAAAGPNNDYAGGTCGQKGSSGGCGTSVPALAPLGGATVTTNAFAPAGLVPQIAGGGGGGS